MRRRPRGRAEVQRRASTTCPTCGGRLRKVFNAVGVVFKGSGFYRTDSRNGSANGDGADSRIGDKKSGAETKSADKEPAGTGSAIDGSNRTPARLRQARSPAEPRPQGRKPAQASACGRRARSGRTSLASRRDHHTPGLLHSTMPSVASPTPTAAGLARAASWHRRKLAVVAAIAAVLTGVSAAAPAGPGHDHRGQGKDPACRWDSSLDFRSQCSTALPPQMYLKEW